MNYIRLQQPLIYLVSDVFEGICTQELYKELTLQMSTGDFHMHQHLTILSVDADGPEMNTDVYELETDALIAEYEGIVSKYGQLRDFLPKLRLVQVTK